MQPALQPLDGSSTLRQLVKHHRRRFSDTFFHKEISVAVQISKIDYVERVITTADERRWPIADLFDGAGLSTRDPKRAVVCVAGEPGGWLSFRLAVFDRRALQ